MILMLNLTIGLGHFLVLFNTGAYLPMIPRIAGSLGVNPAYADWTQANFFLAMAIAFPTATWFLNRWGEMRCLLGAFLIFALASSVCAQTSHYDWFLGARIVQGFVGGLTIPISLRVILRHYTPQRRNLGLTLWALAAITPFTLGPTIGGWITDTLGWRWLFYLNIPIAIGVALLSAIFLMGREVEQPHLPLDWLGLIFLIIALGTLESALNYGEIMSWWRSNKIIFLAIIGFISLVLFVLWEWNNDHPIIDLYLLKRHNFLIGSTGLFFTAFFFQGTIAIFIVEFQLSLGYSAWMVGLLLLPLALFSKIGAIINQYLLNRIDTRILAFFSLVGFSAGSFWVSSYNRIASFDELLWPQIFVGLFLGGLFPPLVAIALSGLRGPSEMRGTTILNLLRVCGQATGIPVMATLWDRRLTFHEHFLREGNINNLTQFYKKMDHEALAKIITHQSAMLTFNELFYIAAWGFLSVAALLLFAKPVIFAEPDIQLRRALEELAEP